LNRLVSTQVSSLFIGSFQTARRMLSQQKTDAPSNLTSYTSYRLAWPSAYLVPATTCTFQLSPDPTHMPGPRLATRDKLNISTCIEQLSSPHTRQDVSTGSSELAIPGTPYPSGLLQIRYYFPKIPHRQGYTGRCSPFDIHLGRHPELLQRRSETRNRTIKTKPAIILLSRARIFRI
jgi:hypothetical protein